MHEDEYELNRLLNWWTQSDYDPYDQFVSDTYRALLPMMQKKHKPTVQEKIQGCLYGGATGDVLGYPIDFMSLDEIRAKYGPEGIRYYDLKNGRAPFSDDTQMLLFTLEGIYMWQDKLLNRHDGATLKNTLYEAYRDWYFTQVNDNSRKEKHKPRTRLYLLPTMHRRRGPGFTCIRALRMKRPGSIGNPYNDSKGNGGVMRVAPIGFMLSRDHGSSEEIMQKVIQLGAESAALTHGHPLGFISAGMMAGLINECVYGKSDDLRGMILYALHNTHALFGTVPSMSELTGLIVKALDLAEEDGDPFEHIAQLGHNSACAESTMAIAIYCALRYQDNFD